jgi:hypothetical protein
VFAIQLVPKWKQLADFFRSVIQENQITQTEFWVFLAWKSLAYPSLL